MATPFVWVEYRLLQDHPGYSVGSDGSVWSCLRHGGRGPGWFRLRQSTSKGYRHVVLNNCHPRRCVFVHRLILEAFVGPCPKGMEARHLNGDRQDNRLVNLAWGTRLENA